MKYISDAFDRGRVADFHKNSYETVFSVFMVAVVFFYRGNAQIVYPDILYYFPLLPASLKDVAGVVFLCALSAAAGKKAEKALALKRRDKGFQDHQKRGGRHRLGALRMRANSG